MSSIGGVGGGRSPFPLEDDPSRSGSGGFAAVPGPAPAPAAPAWSFSPLKPGAIDLGIGLGGLPGLGLGLGLPKYDEQGSFAVRTLAESTTTGLDAAARKNTSGPEAKLLAFVRAAEGDALRSIKADEAKARALPLDSPERRRLEDGIDARVARFKNDVAVEARRAAGAIAARAGKPASESALDAFKSLLPAYLRECIDREGIVVPGVPGSFVPRTDNGTFGGPTGLDYSVEF